VVKTDPTKKIIKNLRNLLARWRKKEFISVRTARSLLYSDGVLPRAYGLPKIHKDNVPLRIIISSLNSPVHSFAAFLRKLLYDNLSKSNNHIANSFELVNKLNNFYIEEHIKIVSFNVVNLFTNIPHDLIIGNIAKKWTQVLSSPSFASHFLSSFSPSPHPYFSSPPPLLPIPTSPIVSYRSVFSRSQSFTFRHGFILVYRDSLFSIFVSIKLRLSISLYIFPCLLYNTMHIILFYNFRFSILLTVFVI